VYNELVGLWLLLAVIALGAGAALAMTVFRRLP